jgi:hypothetical protein
MRRAILSSVAVLLFAGSAQAQPAEMHAPAVCNAIVPPPAELAGWSKRTHIAAAASAEALGPPLTPGKGADVTLLPTRQVKYPVQPAHPGGSGSSGGLLGFTVAKAGTYRVAAGSAAWIEVVRDGKALASVAHSPGPACTGVRKVVDYALTPGAYVLELAGNASPDLSVLVTLLP